MINMHVNLVNMGGSMSNEGGIDMHVILMNMCVICVI